jgi:3-hydroxyisobutyrate dehydrogenase
MRLEAPKYSPMGSGLLTGTMSRERLAGLPDNDWRKHDDRFREPRLSRGLAVAERLENVAERLDTSPGAVAVAWALRNPAVDGAIVGFRRPDQVDPIIAAANLELGEDDIATIEGRREMATTTATRIGFVGLGHMGGNMAARFLAAGYTVYGEDRNPEQAQDLVQDGLLWRERPREVTEAAEIVFTSVTDDGALEAVASGPDGILAGLAAGKIWVDMSTVSPRVSRALAERVHAVGAAMLDAPVSGSVPQVQAGTLTIMVGGDDQAYARVEPILRELGTPTYIGVNGQGLVLKLAINISLAVQMLAFAEGVLLAERAGVDVMTQSAIGSPMLKARAALVLDLPDDAWFDVQLMQKDLVLALDTARQLRVPLPSAAAADELLNVARALGYEHRDIASLFEVRERMAGVD